MATPKYYDSTATGANDGTSWADAFTSLESATDPGDECFVASGHAESKSSGNLTISVGTADSDDPITYTSASSAAGPPTAFTRGAKVTTTSGRDLRFDFAFQPAVFIGFDFVSNDLLLMDSDSHLRYKDCTFELTASNTADYIGPTGDNTSFHCEDSVFKFAHTGQALRVGGNGGRNTFLGCSIDGTGSSPVSLFEILADGTAVDMVGCNFTSATHLIADTAAGAGAGNINITGNRCELPSSIFNGGIANFHTRAEFYACTDGTTLHDVHIEDALGITSEDLNVHLLATNDGTEKYSLKMVSTANTRVGMVPHRIKLCDVFITTANPTIKVETVEDNATPLDESEFWIEVVQPDSTGPLGTVSSTVDSDYGLGTPAAMTASTESWTGTGGFTNESKRSASVTISGGAVGVHTVYANLAPGSVKTVYVDPQPDIT